MAVTIVSFVCFSLQPLRKPLNYTQSSDDWSSSPKGGKFRVTCVKPSCEKWFCCKKNLFLIYIASTHAKMYYREE